MSKVRPSSLQINDLEYFSFLKREKKCDLVERDMTLFRSDLTGSDQVVFNSIVDMASVVCISDSKTALLLMRNSICKTFAKFCSLHCCVFKFSRQQKRLNAHKSGRTLLDLAFVRLS